MSETIHTYGWATSLVLPEHVLVHIFTELTRVPEYGPELEILNNICPSRFSRVCPNFPFLQNANLYRKRVKIFSSATQICTVNLDLRFREKENMDTLEKI